MLEKNARNQKRQLSDFNTEANPGSDKEVSDSSEKEDGNRNHSNLTRQVKFNNSKRA